MRAGRVLLVAVVVAAMVALGGWWQGSEGGGGRVDRTLVPAARADGEVSATWYCAAATAATEAPTGHQVLLTNPAEEPVQAVISAYGAEGPGRSVPVEVPARSPLRVDVAKQLGSAAVSLLVESPSGELTVEHRLTTEDVADQNVCGTFSSGRWYFPALSTASTAAARITLFNPFPEDAGVDIEVATDTVFRLPPSLNGIVVPAGSHKVVDLGAEAVQRRDQFSAVVTLRSGQVVAEASQSYDGTADKGAGPRGLRLQLGVPAPATRWSFAGGFTGSGASERIVLYNPRDVRAEAVVQVTPYGAAADQAPEPFTVQVPALRYAVVDLSAETRVPGEGYHSVLVATEPDTPVVAARALALTGPPTPSTTEGVPTRPDLTRGLADGTGTRVGALRWVVPALEIDDGVQKPVVFIHNPGDGVAVVSVSSLFDGRETPLERYQDVEVPPGESLAIGQGRFGVDKGLVGAVVTSGSPVVVERLLTFDSRNDLSLGLGVPVRTRRAGLVDLARG